MNTQAIRIQRLRDRSQLAFDPDSEYVLSPCLGVCHVHQRVQVCVGCYRTMAEIVRWTSLNNDEKRAIWHSILEKIEAGVHQGF